MILRNFSASYISSGAPALYKAVATSMANPALAEAIQLIQEKKDAEAQKHIKKFEEEPELEILNGRYGPYISYKGNNYKIPKDIIPQDLNLDACREIIKLQSDPDAPKAKRGKYAKKKK